MKRLFLPLGCKGGESFCLMVEHYHCPLEEKMSGEVTESDPLSPFQQKEAAKGNREAVSKPFSAKRSSKR